MENARIASTFRRCCLRVDDKRHHTLVGSYFQYDMVRLFALDTLSADFNTCTLRHPWTFLQETFGKSTSNNKHRNALFLMS